MEAGRADDRIVAFVSRFRSNMIGWFELLAPSFVYFDHYNRLPGRVSLDRLRSEPSSALTAEEQTALSLLRLAQTEPDQLIQGSYESRKVRRDAVSARIRERILGYWSQSFEVEIELDVDTPGRPAGDAGSPAGDSETVMEIRVRDNRHQVSLNIERRSTGFRWFVSFLAVFSEYLRSGRSAVLLLDEPGLGLHGAAQADLLRFFEERLSRDGHVLYTTHSPFMINSSQLERVRIVEDTEEHGSVVRGDVLGIDSASMLPLQAALGYEITQSLFVGAHNLIVEGPSDYVYFTAVSGHLHSQGRTHLDPRWVVVPVGGVDKMPTFVSLLGRHLGVTVVTDAGRRSVQKLDDLVRRGMIPETSVISLEEVLDGRVGDVEDLFDASFYCALVTDSGVATVTPETLPPGSRLVKKVEDLLGHPFDHYQPAGHLLANAQQWLPRLDEPALARFERLFERINGELERTTAE